MRKNLMNVLVVLLICAMSLVLLTACGDSAPKGVELHTTTSAEADVYLYGDTLVNHEGNTRNDVAFDEEGNVMKDGKILVASYNLAMYTIVTEVKAVDETELTQTIEATQEGANQLATKPIAFTINFSIEPANAVNKTVTIESLDPAALYFPYEANADLVKEEATQSGILGAVTPVFDENGQVELSLVGRFDGEFTLIARDGIGNVVGEFLLKLVPEIVESGEGGNAEEISTTEPGSTSTTNPQNPGTQNPTPGTQEISAHVHDFEDQVVAPTPKAQGYTIHTCKTCGYTYRDAFTEQLACQHEYVDTVVPATYLSGGYTVHTCKICGDSYRDSATPVLVCNHQHTKDTVVAPTCHDQGYTIHECLDCHNATFQDSYTAALGHNFNNGKVTTEATCLNAGVKTFTCTRCGETRTESISALGHNFNNGRITSEPTCTNAGVKTFTCSRCGGTRTESVAALGHNYDGGRVTLEPTCANQGTRTFTCTRCGETRTEAIAATGNHTYVTSTQEATCTEGGCTVHTCSVCGDSYQDNTTAPLGHTTTLNWRETQPATCGAAGTREGTCTRCGAVVRTESIPATGNHQYTTTTVPADCEHGGHTVHTCSVCGSSYTDGETGALGHAWEGHTERVWVRQEAHEICATCGMDLTANGIGPGQVWQHMEAHALAGQGTRSYTSYVDIYEERTVYTCTRCGATRTES